MSRRAGGTMSLLISRGWVKLDTPEDRRLVARFVAYELARQFGIDIPPEHWPPIDRWERENYVEGVKFRFGLET